MNTRKNIERHSRKISGFLFSLAAVLALLALAACGGSGDTPPSPPTNTTPPAPVSNTIGPSGGTVTGPNGATVVIPPGALAQDIEIAITQTSTGAPSLPLGMTSVGTMFAFTPHGTTFAVPVTITVPFDPSKVPAGRSPRLLKTNAAQSSFETVVGAMVSGTTMTAQVTSFSFLQVVAPQFVDGPPVDGIHSANK